MFILLKCISCFLEADVSNEVDNLTISNICLTHFTDESYKIPSIKTSLNKDVMTSIGLIDDNLQIFNILGIYISLKL